MGKKNARAAEYDGAIKFDTDAPRKTEVVYVSPKKERSALGRTAEFLLFTALPVLGALYVGTTLATTCGTPAGKGVAVCDAAANAQHFVATNPTIVNARHVAGEYTAAAYKHIEPWYEPHVAPLVSAARAHAGKHASKVSAEASKSAAYVQTELAPEISRHAAAAYSQASSKVHAGYTAHVSPHVAHVQSAVGPHVMPHVAAAKKAAAHYYTNAAPAAAAFAAESRAFVAHKAVPWTKQQAINAHDAYWDSVHPRILATYDGYWTHVHPQIVLYAKQTARAAKHYGRLAALHAHRLALEFVHFVRTQVIPAVKAGAHDASIKAHDAALAALASARAFWVHIQASQTYQDVAAYLHDFSSYLHPHWVALGRFLTQSPADVQDPWGPVLDEAHANAAHVHKHLAREAFRVKIFFLVVVEHVAFFYRAQADRVDAWLAAHNGSSIEAAIAAEKNLWSSASSYASRAVETASLVAETASSRVASRASHNKDQLSSQVHLMPSESEEATMATSAQATPEPTASHSAPHAGAPKATGAPDDDAMFDFSIDDTPEPESEPIATTPAATSEAQIQTSAPVNPNDPAKLGEVAKKREEAVALNAKYEKELGSKGQAIFKKLVADIAADRKRTLKSVADTAESAEKQLSSIGERIIDKLSEHFESLIAESENKTIDPARVDKICEKTKSNVYARGKDLVKPIERAWFDLVTRNEKAIKEAKEEIAALVGTAQTEVGFKYTWLDDVTHADWQRYHKLAKSGESWKAQYAGLLGENPSHPDVANIIDAHTIDGLSDHFVSIVEAIYDVIGQVRDDVISGKFLELMNTKA